MTAESEHREENSRSDYADGEAQMGGEIEDGVPSYGSSAPLLRKPELIKLSSNTEALYDSPKEYTDLSSGDVITETKEGVSSDINFNQLQGTGQQEPKSDEGMGEDLLADKLSGERNSLLMNFLEVPLQCLWKRCLKANQRDWITQLNSRSNN